MTNKLPTTELHLHPLLLWDRISLCITHRLWTLPLPSSASWALGLHACTPVLRLPQYSSLEMWLASAEREGWWTPVCFCSELTIALWLMFKGSGVRTKDLAYDNIASECFPCNGGVPPWVCIQLSFPKKCYKVCPLVHEQFVVSSPRWRCGGMFGALLVHSDGERRRVWSLGHLAVSVEVSLCTQFTTQSVRLGMEALGFDPYFNVMS